MSTSEQRMSATSKKKLLGTPSSVKQTAMQLLSRMRRKKERKSTCGIGMASHRGTSRRDMRRITTVGLLSLVLFTLTPILMSRWTTDSGTLLSEAHAQSSTPLPKISPRTAETRSQDDPPIAVRIGPKPFDVQEPMVFGGVPKTIFPTQILYNVGPTFSREKAITHDGEQFSDPMNTRQWRQIIFELSRNKLNPKVLPNYVDYLTKARDFRWDKAHENTEPILIADVGFEWIAGNLDDSPELQRQADGFYKLQQAARTMTTNKGRFFGASLLPDKLHSRLVTFVLSDKLVYSNLNDAILGVSLSIENNTFSVPMNGSLVVDLGEKEGDKTVYVTAHHRSGQQSKTCFRFALERVNGKWVNTKTENGKSIFEVKQLPTIRFTQKDNQR